MSRDDKMPKTALFIDTETTGLDPFKGDRIIEVACALVSMETLEVTDTWQAICDDIHDNIGIGEYHANAGTFKGVDWSLGIPRKQVMGGLFQRMQGALVIGQNLSFDMKFLRNEAKLLGLEFPKTGRQIDTVPMSFPLMWMGITQDLKLESTRKWASREGKQEHRAMGDVLDTVAVFAKIMRVFQGGAVPPPSSKPKIVLHESVANLEDWNEHDPCFL